MARAVLANESVNLPAGAPLLVAGPWAKAKSAPIVDPSYLMPSVYDALAGLTGDARWTSGASAAVRLIRGLTHDGRRLPPDWAQLSGDRLEPIPQPRGGNGVQYGLDAARVPIWFATACDANARKLAANWWDYLLASDGRSGQTALSLDGATINPQSSPVALLAAAAGATAARHENAARRLRAGAESLALRSPTYYGDAWAALGPALLDGVINPCVGAATG